MPFLLNSSFWVDNMHQCYACHRISPAIAVVRVHGIHNISTKKIWNWNAFLIITSPVICASPVCFFCRPNAHRWQSISFLRYASLYHFSRQSSSLTTHSPSIIGSVRCSFSRAPFCSPICFLLGVCIHSRFGFPHVSVRTTRSLFTTGWLQCLYASVLCCLRTFCLQSLGDNTVTLVSLGRFACKVLVLVLTWIMTNDSRENLVIFRFAYVIAYVICFDKLGQH